MRRLLILLTTALLGATAWADDPPEMRAFYAATWRVNTPAKCDAVIAAALAHSVNAVFVEVRGRADAYYYPNRDDATYPNTEPRGELYTISPSDFDSLQYFIDHFHEASPRVEVHAWLTTFNSWNRSSAPDSASHVYNAHPEWVTEDSSGVTPTWEDDAPLDPGIPAVQDYLHSVFMDIVRNYDIDGIHFDYIRLFSSNSGYDPVALAQFLAETGFTYTPATPGALSEVFEAWRRDQIAQLVQRVHAQTMLEKPWVEVSAFLVNFSDSVEVLGQGYNWWVAHGAIDVLHPGCYSSSVTGTVDDWEFYRDKLAQNSDENTRPIVAAIGDYLLTDAGENATAVTTLRGNSRVPDGFNFFDYDSLFLDGTPAGEHADNLFDPGGPMDDWAPLPAIPHKTDEETTPPNAPASASAALSSGYPRITFNRPAAASGDLPVHYRLYRDTDASVDLYYDNMVMEWWDLNSSRSSFTFDDATASLDTYHYAVVAYDDWNNEASVTVGPVVVTSSGIEHIIETRTGGLNVGDHAEISGNWYDSSSHSTAPGCTIPLGSRWSRPSDGLDDRARFTPSGLTTGNYSVYVTSFNFASANAPNITVRTNDAGGTATSLFDLTAANCGNVWTQCATMDITAGQSHWVEFDSVTQSTSGSNDRMNPAAVRFVRTGITPTPWEPKPAVTAPGNAITEVIVDSTPQALDYDDNGSVWQTSTLSGYHNANARYFPSGSYPLDDYAIWVVDLPQTGTWAIDGWVRHNTAFAQGAQYRFVDSAGAVHSVATSQRSTFNDTTSGDWLINVDGVSDGSAYHFNAGRVYVIVYGNTAGSQTVIADALRFRLLSPTGGVAHGLLLD